MALYALDAAELATKVEAELAILVAEALDASDVAWVIKAEAASDKVLAVYDCASMAYEAAKEAAVEALTAAELAPEVSPLLSA